MKHYAKHLLVIGLGLTGMLQAMPVYATAILEATIESGSRHYSGVELIEGEEIKRVPPIPRVPGAAVYSVADTPSSPGVLQSQGGRDMTSRLVARLITQYNRNLSPYQVHQLTDTINLVSESYNLDPRLVASLVAVESSFNPTAISKTGAIGLGQLKPATARWLGVHDPYDPVQNLYGVGKYLRYLLDRYQGSVQHALAAYFQGQGTIDRRGIDEGALYYIGKISRVLGRL